jgi:hypothetical protein
MSVARRRALKLCGLAICTLPTFHGAALADGTECKYFSQLPDDCVGAELRKYDNLRNYRYEEIDLFARDVIKKVRYVSSYNTTGLNGGDESGDSAPQPLAHSLDPKGIAKRYQALSVWVSPPRYWTFDWLVDRFGRVRSFGDLNAAWVGDRPAAAAAEPSKSALRSYRYLPVARTAAKGFKKGSKVYLLDDPKGRTWIMTSYTDKIVTGLTLDKLETLGSLLTLPPGWKFRAAALDKELVLLAKSGSAATIQDDKENIYDLTGAGQSNFSP